MTCILYFAGPKWCTGTCCISCIPLISFARSCLAAGPSCAFPGELCRVAEWCPGRPLSVEGAKVVHPCYQWSNLLDPRYSSNFEPTQEHIFWVNHKKSRGNSELDPSSCREFARWPWVEGTVDGCGWASWSCRGHMPPWVRVEVSIGSATTWDDSSGRRSWIPGFGRSIRCGRSGQGHPEDHPGRVNGAMLKIGNLALMNLVRTQQEDETDKLDWTSGDDFVMHEIKICLMIWMYWKDHASYSWITEGLLRYCSFKYRMIWDFVIVSHGARWTTFLCFLLWEAESHYDLQHIQIHPNHPITRSSRWETSPSGTCTCLRLVPSWQRTGWVGWRWGGRSYSILYSIAYLCWFVFGKLWLEDP